MLSKTSFFIVFVAALIGLGSMVDQLGVPSFSFQTKRDLKRAWEWSDLGESRGPLLQDPLPNVGLNPNQTQSPLPSAASPSRVDDQREVQVFTPFISLLAQEHPVHSESVQQDSERNLKQASLQGSRRKMLELLDQLVRSEWAYQKKTGRFTHLLSKVPHFFFSPADFEFEVRVLEARADQLLVGAFSESSEGLSDQAWVNERYELRANFLLPQPSPDYLKSVALEYLQSLENSSASLSQMSFTQDEPTVFKRYFQYQLTHDSNGQNWSGPKTIKAWGVKPPVEGLVLEWRNHTQMSLWEGKTQVITPIHTELLIQKVQANEPIPPVQEMRKEKMRGKESREEKRERKISSTPSDLQMHRVRSPSLRVQFLSGPLEPLLIEPLESGILPKR